MEPTGAHLRLQRIVSGGQTGVDRGALDAAKAVGMDHGGWCPRGRLAEDGEIPESYHLEETRSPRYRVRTERNVIDSDATLILHSGRLEGGTRFTREMAVRHERPHLLVDLAADADVGAVRRWLVKKGIGVLNVAGPRESSAPGIGLAAREFVVAIFSHD